MVHTLKNKKMIKWLIRIIWGDDCNHEWYEIKRNETPSHTNFLFVCQHCGRFKKQSV